MGTDWGLALQVVVYGFSAVFLVLVILMFSVQAMSAVIMGLEKRGKEEAGANN
ncbi:MAG: OadG family protein [Firmicutes bacterium]|nr:OadG family protein [Bacillota bacterium]